MSRHNRDRRRRRRQEKGWCCSNAKCRAPMDRDTSLAMLAEEAKRFGPRTAPATIICPLCNTFHVVTAGTDAIRAMTPNERFQLHVEIPRAAAWAERHQPPLFAPQVLTVPVEE